MSRLSSQLSFRLIVVSVVFAPSLLAVAAMGILGLRSASRSADVLYRDILATYDASAVAAQRLDALHVRCLGVATSSGSARTEQIRLLVMDDLPALDSAVQSVVVLHEQDTAEEHGRVEAVVDHVAALRSDVILGLIDGAHVLDREQLDERFDSVRAQLSTLLERERADAGEAHATVAAHYRSRRNIIVAITAVALLIGVSAIYVIVRRVVPRALAPEQAQARFAEVMQLAEDEGDAHQLLRRHLERAVGGGEAVILNRNNSANRLDAMTVLPDDSPLRQTLEGAGPRACLAVRLARPQGSPDNDDDLLTCSVCGACPGARICAPLTVGGEVIGSVLVTAPSITETAERRVRQSVMQAAPILANLRNLAVAELRASTDSLTGLPNRRAAQDTLKRMVAHASRTVSPLAALLIDLDHFKHVNDQFGHAAGDEVLAAVGAVLRSCLRASDFACRQGGEEFLVLLPDTGEDAALVAADKIRASLSAVRIQSVDRRITASIGIAVLPSHAGDGEALQRAADRALYVAKGNGRDRSELATC